MDKLKIGVLGASNHLIKRIILPLKNTNNCELYAIASRSEEKAKKVSSKFGIPVSYGNYEDLLSDESVDAIYIPLPNHLHSEWIKKCADANKPILCEKPISLNREEALDVFTYTKQQNVLLMEAFMYKFHPLWLHVKNIVDTNQIGAIQYINVAFSYNNPSKANIRNIKEFGGGGMYDIGCYAVSVPRFLLGSEPKRVVSLLNRNEETKTDTLSSAIMDFEGTIVTFNVSTLSEANQNVEIVGAAGRISIPIPFNTYVDTESEVWVHTAQGSRNLTFEVSDQYGLMFEAFAEVIIKNQDLPISAQDSINNAAVIDAIFKSSEINSWVTV